MIVPLSTPPTPLYYIQQNYQRSPTPMNTRQAIISGPRYFGTAQKKSCLQSNDPSLPGPGTHNPSPLRTIPAPEWKIGEEANRLTFLDPHRKPLPSPQHYHVTHASVQKSSRKMTIPLSNYHPRRDVNDNYYNPNVSLVKNAWPEISFGYWQETDYSTLPPGPGAYETLREKVSFNKGQKGFSSGLRPPPYGEAAKFPGPGKYSTIAFAPESKYSFGRASKDHKIRDPPVPFYNLSVSQKPFRVASQPSESYREPSFIPRNEVPASNVYHNELPYRIPNGVMELSKRTPIEYTAIIKHPSPDKYTGQRQFATKKTQSFAKQSRQLGVRAKTVPGPGAYEAVPTLSNLGGAMPKKKPSKEEQELPGAASYFPQEMAIRKKASSTVMLRSQRTDFSRTITGAIGPGEYNIDGNGAGEFGRMGRSDRPHHSSPDKNPGVGNYNLPNFIGKLPKYCTSPRKISEAGLSTLHEKLKYKISQKKNLMKSLELRKKRSEVKQQQPSQIIESNPQN